MSVSFINAAFNSNAAGANATSFSVNKPTNTADGDLMIAQATHQQTGAITITAPSGWILFDNLITAAVSPQTETKFYMKLAASEGASYTWTQSVGTPFAVAISTWRGAYGIHARGAVNEVTSGNTSITTNSATSTVTGLPVYFASQSLTASVTETTFSATATEIYDHGNDNGSINMTQAAYYTSDTSAGTVPGLAITFSQAVTHGIGHTLVLADTGPQFWPFAATGTFICPNSITTADVECVSGGGAGGSGSVSGAAGGGGAGGNYVKTLGLAVSAGTSYTVTVGAGGVASTAPSVDGATNPGGDSWFNTTGTIIAKGGAGGGDRATSGNGTAGAGSTTGCIGTTKNAGGSGAAGATASIGGGGGGGAGTGGAGGSASGSTAGTGTATYGGNGTAGVSATNAANVSSSYGGGGGGARATSNTDRIGGNGGAGFVMVTVTKSSIPDMAPAPEVINMAALELATAF